MKKLIIMLGVIFSLFLTGCSNSEADKISDTILMEDIETVDPLKALIKLGYTKIESHIADFYYLPNQGNEYIAFEVTHIKASDLKFVALVIKGDYIDGILNFGSDPYFHIYDKEKKHTLTKLGITKRNQDTYLKLIGLDDEIDILRELLMSDSEKFSMKSLLVKKDFYISEKTKKSFKYIEKIAKDTMKKEMEGI